MSILRSVVSKLSELTRVSSAEQALKGFAERVLHLKTLSRVSKQRNFLSRLLLLFLSSCSFSVAFLSLFCFFISFLVAFGVYVMLSRSDCLWNWSCQYIDHERGIEVRITNNDVIMTNCLSFSDLLRRLWSGCVRFGERFALAGQLAVRCYR